MPRKKSGISIEQALRVLHDKGVEVEVKSIKHQEEVRPKLLPEHFKETPNEVTITLHAAHSITSPMKKGKKGENPSENDPMVCLNYGPGKVTVPTRLASILLYRDQQAIEYDKEFSSGEFKEYLGVQYHTPHGTSYRALRVPSGFISNMDPTKLGPHQVIPLG